MYVIEVFLVKIILLCCLFEIEASFNDDYNTLCTCTQAPPNETFCWSYQCQTNEIVTCCSSDSTVEIKSKKKERKSMNNLKIGDEILVDINNQGQRIYEPIYSFIHANPNGIHDYLNILVENNSEQSLIISSKSCFC
jgi:hypothetical protein